MKTYMALGVRLGIILQSGVTDVLLAARAVLAGETLLGGNAMPLGTDGGNDLKIGEFGFILLEAIEFAPSRPVGRQWVDGDMIGVLGCNGCAGERMMSVDGEGTKHGTSVGERSVPLCIALQIKESWFGRLAVTDSSHFIETIQAQLGFRVDLEGLRERTAHECDS